MKPLSGYRIVEVEGLGPAPFTGMMLADLGADVIVVNRETEVDLGGISQRRVTDRGKRSIILDLKSEADRKIFLSLIETADALIEGFRPGVMEKLGLGPDQCQGVNPKLVYGRMTGWGQHGEMSGLAGHDLNFLALSGALSLGETDSGEISAPPTLIGDIGGGALYLVIGIISALLAVSNGKDGTVIDAAIVDGAAHLQNLLFSLNSADHKEKSGKRHPLSSAHWSRVYACSDGRHISVQCVEPKFYRIFLEKLGLENDEEFLNLQFSQSAWPKLVERLTEIFASKPQARWIELFANSDACVFPVLTPEEAAKHSHNLARGTWNDDGTGLQAAPAPRFGDGQNWSPSPIPQRGEHTEEILTELDRGKKIMVS